MSSTKPKSIVIENDFVRVEIIPRNRMGEMIVGSIFVQKIQSLLEALASGYLEAEHTIMTRHEWKPGYVLRHYRCLKNWTQERLAYETKIHPARISRLERHRANIGKKTALKLAEALGCHYLEFL